MKHLTVHSADVLELLMSSLLIRVGFQSKLHFFTTHAWIASTQKNIYFEYLQF